MPYSRIQGNKLLILHSKRIDGQVKQTKLHSFNSFSEAHDIVNSDSDWNFFCETLTMQFNVKINKPKLQENIKTKLKKIEIKEIEPVSNAVLLVLNFLKNCEPPLSPEQIKILKKAKINLLAINNVINEKLNLLEVPMESITKYEETEADQCLEHGLDLYRQGDWDEAKLLFLKGLKAEPNHVDLLVHAGLIEFIHRNFSLALNYFNDAMEIGKQLADLMIATDPDEYIKNIDLDKWNQNKICGLADECPNLMTDECNDCDENPKNQQTELYKHLEFRPFFRALTNKALTLMKLKKFEGAIETLKLCQEYQPLWGTYNMMGICYLNLGNIQKADDFYSEFFWNEPYYIKALIKFLHGKNKEAFEYLLPGIIKNPYIADMITGIEKPEKIRYLGDVLPDRLKASEFIHEEGYLFKAYPSFRNLIHCILEYDEIAALLNKLECKKKNREADRNYNMDKNSWNLLHGNISNDFINQYVPRFFARLNNKNGDYWHPKTDDELNIQIIEKKQQNWLVQLKNHEKKFYFRPRFYVEGVKNGDLIRICITKSWFYKRKLFVSGKIEE